MPSARPESSSARPLLYARIAWLSAGVGTQESLAFARIREGANLAELGRLGPADASRYLRAQLALDKRRGRALVGQAALTARTTSEEEWLKAIGLGLVGKEWPDGRLLVTAVDAVGVSVSSRLTIAITRTLAAAALQPALLTPNGDGNGDALTVTFQLAVPATVRLRVLRDDEWVATPYTGALPAGPQTLGWNGAKRVGKTLDGSYTAVIDATDPIGTATVSLPFQLDAHPPVVKLAARPVRLWISVRVPIQLNGSTRLPPSHATAANTFPTCSPVGPA